MLSDGNLLMSLSVRQSGSQVNLAAERAPDSIDDVLAFVEASNKRIATMEAKASGIIKKPIWCV